MRFKLSWKYAITYASLLWMLSIFEITVLLQIPVLLQHPGLQEAIFFLVYAILVLICSRLYFINTTPDLNEAFFLGLVFVGVSFILDVIVTVPLFLSSYYAFFFDWEVWLSYILTLGLVVASVYLQPFIERFK